MKTSNQNSLVFSPALFIATTRLSTDAYHKDALSLSSSRLRVWVKTEACLQQHFRSRTRLREDRT